MRTSPIDEDSFPHRQRLLSPSSVAHPPSLVPRCLFIRRHILSFPIEQLTEMAKLQFLLAGLYATSALASPWARIKRGSGWGDDEGGPGGYGDDENSSKGHGWGYGGKTCKPTTVYKTQEASTVSK